MTRHPLLPLVVAAFCVTAGCVSGVGLWKREQTTMPYLVGAVVADIVVTSVITSQVQDFTVGATIGTTLALTAVDVTIGCFLGACAPLKL